MIFQSNVSKLFSEQVPSFHSIYILFYIHIYRCELLDAYLSLLSNSPWCEECHQSSWQRQGSTSGFPILPMTKPCTHHYWSAGDFSR